MKNKYIIFAVLMIMAIFLPSCSKTTQSPSAFDEETAEQTVTDIPYEAEYDPFEKIRQSDEKWLEYGLYAYENKKTPDLKGFFIDMSSLSYLTLYDHLFVYDEEKYVPVAEGLFAFIYEEYGAEALLDIDKRCEYKTAFLKFLGSDLEYIQTKEIETFFANMDFESNSLYKYIMSFDNVTYYFKDLDYLAIPQYHGFLYFSTTGLFEMIDYLESNELDRGLDTDRQFKYYMTFDDIGYSVTRFSSGDMYINDLYSTLHEAVHAMGIQTIDNIWLSEGICNYFGRALGFNKELTALYVQTFKMAENGSFNDLVAVDNSSAILYKKLAENYLACGGKLDSIDDFDYRLFTDLYAINELDTGSFDTVSDTFTLINNKKYTAVGGELSYEQSLSLVIYLVERYGIEKVMDAYYSQDIISAFGKDYEELKTDWLNYLGKYELKY